MAAYGSEYVLYSDEYCYPEYSRGTDSLRCRSVSGITLSSPEKQPAGANTHGGDVHRESALGHGGSVLP